ncbi:MAG: malto-oligosyltrehalose synthase [Betaproteobacteria bacterium]|nr:malto-oligosyltrehalose synthase [Betaproteobacteria bacterium]
MSDPQAMERLSAGLGIAAEYTDIWGKRHPTSAKTRRALLEAMGIPGDGSALRQAAADREMHDWRRLLPPVAVVREADAPHAIAVAVPAAWSEREFRWTLRFEDGGQRSGSFRAADLPLTGERRIGGASFLRHAWHLDSAPAGYHTLEIRDSEIPERCATMQLIVTPASCYQPAALGREGRVWGLSVQLYSLRSRRNWGIGDFTDLRGLVEVASGSGADVVGVNPLHALFFPDPERASPYGASSRCFLNWLYIDTEAEADFAECEAARAAVAAPEFQARLRRLRATELVDYAGVAAVKREILELLYRHFRDRHLPGGGERSAQFRAFRSRRGAALRNYALFEALQEHFCRHDPPCRGWPAWPAAYRDPASPEVAAFTAAHAERIEFFEYLQWIADRQLAAVGRRSLELGLGVGLYQDLALGAAADSAEVWGTQALCAMGAHIGSPPDEFNLRGQDWGLPPFVPDRLRETGFAPFVAALRANMQHAGALRLDHVMALFRLFWVPADAPPAEGAYVAYPLEDLLGILALESRRNRCLVVGEDLGTVPDELREQLRRMGVLGCRPLYFEKEADGAFKSPESYPVQALASVATHDLPTLCGFWNGYDLDQRARLGLFPSDAAREAQVIARAQDRARLLMALDRAGLLPPGASVHPVGHPEISPELAQSIHVFLARTPAKVLMVQPEDVFGVAEQANLPGSGRGHPNWCRKLPLDLEEWAGDPRLRTLAEAVGKVRTRTAAAPQPGRVARAEPRIPLATYRLQFGGAFTFAQAAALVPYLHGLGVSHCYASPYLKARPGSRHGYDIIDHNALNPEIGTRGDYGRFVEALRRHGMGQILDLVPNHMGVMGSDNAWWLDVLENGPASVYADFFDIDWTPLKDELRYKVLLPVLGDHYGTVLDRGELTLAFDAGRGEFSVHYFEHRFPLDPAEYPRVLRHCQDRLAAALGADNPVLLDCQALTTAFGHLPGRVETSADKVLERNRDKEVHKRHLADLAARSPEVAAFIAENVGEFNGRPGDQASFDALHELIKAQAFRLAFWRVASDEINYRRFFDINDLAGLRMENPAVFEATHRLVFSLIDDGSVEGLRIDHPDGLYDPGEYFRRLQAHFRGAAAEAGETAGKPARFIYLVGEKILAEHERLPEDWPVHGTTGYRFANVLNGLFVDVSAESRLDRIYADFTGEHVDFDDLAYRCKRLIMKTAMAGELNMLARELSRIALASRHTCDFTLNSLRDALAEVGACFPVYRTYISPQEVSAADRRHIEWAVAVARKRSRAADVSVFDFVRGVLTTDIAEGRNPAYRDRVLGFAMRFQQFSAPVMAKGVEDTAFYICNRLVSLNEVGGDPRSFGFSLEAFHAASRDRALNWPHTMLATSTHDSKRSEDVRARIDVLSEIPALWKLNLRRWRRLNRNKKSMADGEPAPWRNDEYLLYQALIGTWPLEPPDEEALNAYRERIERYMLKAVREAKVASSWINVNTEYEAALSKFVGSLLAPGPRNLFLPELNALARQVAHFGMLNSLAMTLIKLTSPGVPDIYQGNELWDFSLVDPDNRRPVDFDRRTRLLDELTRMAEEARGDLGRRVHALLDRLSDGRAKFFVTWRALGMRRALPELFGTGDYVPIKAAGERADHVCAFARTKGANTSITVAPRLVARLLGGDMTLPLGTEAWRDTRIDVPWAAGQAYRNVLTGEILAPEPRNGTHALPLWQLLRLFPVALLQKTGGETGTAS